MCVYCIKTLLLSKVEFLYFITHWDYSNAHCIVLKELQNCRKNKANCMTFLLFLSRYEKADQVWYEISKYIHPCQLAPCAWNLGQQVSMPPGLQCYCFEKLAVAVRWEWGGSWTTRGFLQNGGSLEGFVRADDWGHVGLWIYQIFAWKRRSE